MKLEKVLFEFEHMKALLEGQAHGGPNRTSVC